ncbi:hypothetical protein TrVFT333_001960 [Trichoderma virens FT-333]|nr:hypothetical protein TrVFT333_001960 [Trichoderma virens FT-333]
MASFMSSFFPGSSSISSSSSKDKPPRAGDAAPRPVTPTMNNINSFINPLNTPLGSPSKKTIPPGAHDLPTVFDTAMNLNSAGIETPIKLARPQSVVAPLSPGKASTVQPPPQPHVQPLSKQPIEELSAAVQEAVQNATKGRASPGRASPGRASPGTPRRRQAHDKDKDNAPVPRLAAHDQDRQPHHSHAALSRQQLYETKERPIIAKRFNTVRGLTDEEREILQRPNVRRMVNVTQLCRVPSTPETDDETHGLMWSKYTGRERANLRKRRIRLKQGDFQILTQVGQGGYGQVFLAQKKDTREVCALKVMSKKLLFKLDEIRHVLTERDILTTAQSDWLVRLLYSFQDDKNIYLAMEYVPGGDFRTLLNNTGVLSNRHARFYIAEMFCAVDALHQLGYIHRDLKPENFLVDSTGHVKLTDFGLAAGVLAPSKIESMRLKLEQASETPVPFGKPIGQRTVAERRESYRTMRENDVNYAKSIVGSPDYMAPEVLRGEEYDYTVDYWSLGCMLFEALTGFPPFAGATPDETWRNLKHWKEVLKRPVWEDPNYFLSNRTWSFITTCINSRAKRFSNIKDIYDHQYFSEVDWDTLRQTRAPFVPELDSETDAGYFDDFGNDADMAKYKEVHDKQAALENMAEREEEMSKSLFVGFTFRHRKPATEDGVPRKRIPTDESSFGTMF